MTKRTREEILASRPKRTPEEFREASYHVWYECEMLKYCANELLPHGPSDGESFAVLMESFLIHARNLNQFLYGRERYLENCRLDPDEVIAEDFFAGYEPWVKPQDYRISEDNLRRINRQLAHISYGRKRSTRNSWDFADLAKLTRMFKLFVEEAPGTRLHPEILAGYPRPFYPLRK